MMTPRAKGGADVLDETDVPEDEAQMDADSPEDETEDIGADAPGTDSAPAGPVESLNDFWAAVDAVDQDEPDYTAVNEEYNKLSRSGKTKANHAIKARINESVVNDDLATAKKYALTGKSLASVGTAQETADPTEELTQRIAAFRIANTDLSTAELEPRIAALVETPTEIVTALVAKLVEKKMASKPRQGTGTRHNVGRHIAQIFEPLDSGAFLTAQEIANSNSEEYGDDPTNVASVNTHLNSGKFEQNGLSVETRDGKLGVAKQ